MGTRNRVDIGLSSRPARLHSLANFVPWDRFFGSLNFYKIGLWCREMRIDVWNYRKNVSTKKLRTTKYENEALLLYSWSFYVEKRATSGQIQSPWQRNKVDSGIGLPMVNVLESTLEWTSGEVIGNSGIGSHTPCFSLDSASDLESEHGVWPILCRVVFDALQ